MSLRLAAYGEFDCDVDFGSQSGVALRQEQSGSSQPTSDRDKPHQTTHQPPWLLRHHHTLQSIDRDEEEALGKQIDATCHTLRE